MVKHNNKVHQLSGSCRTFILFNIIILSLITNPANTSALTYQQSTDIEFTFNPTISVSVSGDLTIDQLTPGDSSDSNIIDINVSTNNVSGYSLSATTGNVSNATTDLKRSDNINNKFTSLAASDHLPSLTTENTWGYSYSSDSGTSWSNYSGLPLYTATGTVLKQNYNPAEDTINFKIAAKASNTQVSGDYTNVINFYAIGNPEVKYYIHEFTNELCSTLATNDNYTVYDIRDGNDYTVRYINGNCWMTQNLHITGTVSAEYSNFTGEDFNVCANDLTSSNSYTETRCHSSNDNRIGTYYNYCAISAGTACNDTDIINITNDICPINWRVPTILQFNDIVTSVLLFQPNANGYYRDRRHENLNYGFWWSATGATSTPTGALRMYYDVNNNTLGTDGGDNKTFGMHVRCVRSS